MQVPLARTMAKSERRGINIMWEANRLDKGLATCSEAKPFFGGGWREPQTGKDVRLCFDHGRWIRPGASNGHKGGGWTGVQSQCPAPADQALCCSLSLWWTFLFFVIYRRPPTRGACPGRTYGRNGALQVSRVGRSHDWGGSLHGAETSPSHYRVPTTRIAQSPASLVLADHSRRRGDWRPEMP